MKPPRPRADRWIMDVLELPMDVWDDPDSIWALLGVVGGSD